MESSKSKGRIFIKKVHVDQEENKLIILMYSFHGLVLISSDIFLFYYTSICCAENISFLKTYYNSHIILEVTPELIQSEREKKLTYVLKTMTLRYKKMIK
jgi:hypothetical protein